MGRRTVSRIEDAEPGEVVEVANWAEAVTGSDAIDTDQIEADQEARAAAAQQQRDNLEKAFAHGQRNPGTHVDVASAALITGYSIDDINVLAKGSNEAVFAITDDGGEHEVVNLPRLIALITRSILDENMQILTAEHEKVRSQALIDQAEKLCEEYRREGIRRESEARDAAKAEAQREAFDKDRLYGKRRIAIALYDGITMPGERLRSVMAAVGIDAPTLSKNAGIPRHHVDAALDHRGGVEFASVPMWQNFAGALGCDVLALVGNEDGLQLHRSVMRAADTYEREID